MPRRMTGVVDDSADKPIYSSHDFDRLFFRPVSLSRRRAAGESAAAFRIAAAAAPRALTLPSHNLVLSLFAALQGTANIDIVSPR